MSQEEQIAQALGISNEEDLDKTKPSENADDGGKEEVPAELSEIELEAQEMGHVSKEEWTQSGKDPEDWVTPREFVRYGKLQSAMHRKIEAQASEFEQRLNNLNQYHEAQLKLQLNSLKQQQRQAASDGDIEEFDRIDNELKELAESAPPASASLAKPVEVIAWEKENPWIYDANDNRTILANAKYSQYLAANPNATQAQALAHITSEVEAAFPKTNPRRKAATPTTETSHRQTNTSKLPTMNDLTFDERQLWNLAGDDLYGGDQKLFLTAVADARKQ